MKRNFGVYELGTNIIVESSRTSNDDYNHKSGIVLSVTKNGWHTVLVEGSKIKLRTNELKESKKPKKHKRSKKIQRRHKNNSVRPKSLVQRRPKSLVQRRPKSLVQRRPKSRTQRRPKSRTQRRRSLKPQQKLPFLLDVRHPKPKPTKHKHKTRRSIKKTRGPPPVPRRPKSLVQRRPKSLVQRRHSSDSLRPKPVEMDFLEEARKDAQNRLTYRKNLLFLNELGPKNKKSKKRPQRKSQRKVQRKQRHLPQRKQRPLPQRKYPTRPKLERQKKMTKKEIKLAKTLLAVGGFPHGWTEQHHKKTTKKLTKQQKRAKIERERIEKAKRDYQKYKEEYDRKVAEEEANRPRPPLDIGSGEFDPKSIDYFFETTDYMIQGNKQIKSMYIGDDRFYGHTDDGVIVDADLDKITDFGLEDPKGLSIVFFWTDGLERNRLKFNFDSKEEFGDFYSAVYYEVYPDGVDDNGDVLV